MKTYYCPICETPLSVAAEKAGERLTCTNCFAQLALYLYKGMWHLACAMCKERVFDPQCCENCERRKEQKRLLEKGAL